MQVQNNLKCDIFLPYAGIGRRGVVIKAGKMSCQLPPTKFNDPLLQRDWRGKKITVVLSEADKVYLGALVAGLETLPVTVHKNTVKPVRQKVPTVTESHSQKSQRLNKEVVTEVPDVTTHGFCSMCGREDRLSMDPALKQNTCTYCKRTRNKQMSKGITPPPAETQPPSNLAGDRPEPPTPTVVKAAFDELVHSKPSSGVPGTAEPIRKQPSLADLMKANSTVKQRRPNTGVGAANTVLQGPLAFMEQDNFAKQIKGQV